MGMLLPHNKRPDFFLLQSGPEFQKMPEIWCWNHISGEVVYVLSAYDLDEADVLNYSLSGPDAPYFHINQNGVIVAARELVMQDYSLTAIVSDQGGLNTSVGLGFYMAGASRFPVFEVKFFSFSWIFVKS